MSKPPAALKPIHPYLLLHKTFKDRDPIVSYYAKLYAVQEGIKLSKNDAEAKTYLLGMMDELDQMKTVLKGEEALQSEIVGQAHVEEVGLKLFEHADKEDRAARFHKNMVKSFLTSSHIFTILKQFGDINEEVEAKMKYAKWKVVEIDRCLKAGITPTPGPPGGSDTGSEEGAVGPTSTFPSGPSDASTSYPPGPGYPSGPGYPPGPGYPSGPGDVYPSPLPGDRPVPKPRHNVHSTDMPAPTGFSVLPDPTTHTTTSEDLSTRLGAMGSDYTSTPSGGFVPGQAETTRAQKLIKYASSALDYDDVTGAIEYMNQAIRLLKTGKE